MLDTVSKTQKGYIYQELIKNGFVYTEREPKHITALATQWGINVATERVMCISNKTLEVTKITKVVIRDYGT